MRVRKLLRRRMVTTGFADRGLFGAETESARKGLPGRCKCCRMCLFRSGCNTVPIEKGTETIPSRRPWRASDVGDATPSPTRRGLKPEHRIECWDLARADATPSPSRRGLETRKVTQRRRWVGGCNTVPIEKGLETRNGGHPLAPNRDANTVPIERDAETRCPD